MDAIKVRCCPRCGGAMYLSSDRYGEFLSCLNCGHLLSEGRPGPSSTKPEPTAWHSRKTLRAKEGR